MTIDIQDLVLIEEIEKAGSFSGAANALLRTRSAITQHVQKLEDQLGFQIYDRSHYRPILTAEGQHFLERGKSLLQGFYRLRADLQHIQQGWESEFSLAIDDVIGIEKVYFLLEQFRQVAPQVTIRLYREVLNGCWDALATHRANIVIGASGEPPMDLICKQEQLGSIEFVYAVSQDHALTRAKEKVTPEMLAMYPMIVVSYTSISLAKRTSGIVSQQSKIIVPTMEDKIAAQVRGLGIGYVPLTRVQHLIDEGTLVQLDLLHHSKKKADVKIAYIEQPQSKAFEWFLKTFLSEDVKKKILGKQTN